MDNTNGCYIIITIIIRIEIIFRLLSCMFNSATSIISFIFIWKNTLVIVILILVIVIVTVIVTVDVIGIIIRNI